MSETLFSAFLMVDQVALPAGKPEGPRSPIGGRRLPSKAAGEQTLREALRALVQTMEQTAPVNEMLAGTSAPQLAELAATMADVALGRSVILKLKPGLAAGERSAVRTFLEMIVRLSSTLEESRLEAAIEKLADVILPDELGDARGALASDNLELRDRFIADVPQLTSAGIGARAGLQTKNPYATAARWKKAGEIFSVQHRGTEYFPAFQFRDGRPHPTVRKALAALPSNLSAWQRAFWFVSTNGWLGDKAPADMLDEPDAVVMAAKREGQEVVG